MEEIKLVDHEGFFNFFEYIRKQNIMKRSQKMPSKPEVGEHCAFKEATSHCGSFIAGVKEKDVILKAKLGERQGCKVISKLLEEMLLHV